MRETKLLSDRVKDAFSNSDVKAFAEKYLDVLYTNWQNATNKQQRAIFTFLLLSFTFELVTKASISEVSIGPLKITNLSLIHKLIPAAMAYYYFEILTWGKERVTISEVYREVVNACYPLVVENKLQHYLSPEGISIFGYKYRRLENKFLDVIQEIIRMPILLFINLAPFIVGAYAFYQLFNLFGFRDIFVWFSLSSFILMAILAYTSLGKYSLS